MIRNKKETKLTIENVYGKFVLPTLTVEEFNRKADQFDKIPKNIKHLVGYNGDEPVYKEISWVEKEAIDSKSEFAVALGTESMQRAMVYDNKVDGVNDGNCRIKNSSVKVKHGTVLKGHKAIVAVRQSLNLERDVIIPLPHSHFSISLYAFSPAEKIKLNETIITELTDYCSESLGLIFSHDSVVYYKTIVDFLKTKLKSYTLDIPDNEDIFDYIDARDLTSILAYLASAIHPKGVDTLITCSNKMTLNDDKTDVICKHTVKGLLYPREMLYVDESKITELGNRLLKKTKPKSITLEELKESKIDASYLMDKEFVYGSLTFTLSFCSVNRYLTSGSSFINRLLDLIDDSVMLLDNEKERKEKINKFIELLIVNKYEHFISKIEIEDSGIIEDGEDIFNTLENLIEEEDISVNLINDIVNTIQTEKISYVATPTYKCPNCKKTTNGVDKIDKLELIELNALEVFTNLRIML